MTILATLIVKGGRVTSQYPKALEFDPPTGVVSFPNPDGLEATPVVSYISPTASHATETVYLKEIGKTTVTVWQGAQDSSGRNHAPTDFTLVVSARA